jgi:hypothetical protein
LLLLLEQLLLVELLHELELVFIKGSPVFSLSFFLAVVLFFFMISSFSVQSPVVAVGVLLVLGMEGACSVLVAFVIIFLLDFVLAAFDLAVHHHKLVLLVLGRLLVGSIFYDHFIAADAFD